MWFQCFFRLIILNKIDRLNLRANLSQNSTIFTPMCWHTFGDLWVRIIINRWRQEWTIIHFKTWLKIRAFLLEISSFSERIWWVQTCEMKYRRIGVFAIDRYDRFENWVKAGLDSSNLRDQNSAKISNKTKIKSETKLRLWQIWGKERIFGKQVLEVREGRNHRCGIRIRFSSIRLERIINMCWQLSPTKKSTFKCEKTCVKNIWEKLFNFKKNLKISPIILKF